jgi:hypothetical protein
MRKTIFTAIASLGLALAASAYAAPVAPNLPSQPNTNVVETAWGCGWGFHPNRWGHCVPNRYGYHPRYWGGYSGGYYGGGYHRYWRHHHHWYGY